MSESRFNTILSAPHRCQTTYDNSATQKNPEFHQLNRKCSSWVRCGGAVHRLYFDNGLSCVGWTNRRELAEARKLRGVNHLRAQRGAAILLRSPPPAHGFVPRDHVDRGIQRLHRCALRCSRPMLPTASLRRGDDCSLRASVRVTVSVPGRANSTRSDSPPRPMKKDRFHKESERIVCRRFQTRYFLRQST